MKPAPFEYWAPGSLDEALAVLAGYGTEAKVLAGGQSLVPLLNFRLAKPACLVDLNRIPELSYIRESPDGLSIGAMTRQAELERSEAVENRAPLLAAATKLIGHAAIRHRGTVGGSLAHADPAAELPAAALIHNATLKVAGPQGSRDIRAEQFFIDYLATAMAPGEILQEIFFPARPQRAGYAVEELARRHGDFALAGVAAMVELDENSSIAGARIALFGLSPTAVRARKAEAALKGQPPGPDLFREAASLLDEAMDPPSDIHASGDYRRRVAAVLAVRALAKATGRCQKRAV